ncbi:MAG: extracellular solute-binding protein [Lachnospirales bacterium]
MKIKIFFTIALTLIFCSCSKSDTKKAIKNDITITALIQQSTSTNTGLWKGWAANKLHRDTGIKVNFYNSGRGNSEMLKQYIAAGTLPDVIGFNTSQISLLMDTNLLKNLNQYKEELPNIFETEYQKAIEYTNNEYGNSENLYILPSNIGPQLNTNSIPMVQWAIYDEINKPSIKTLEDYLNIIEEMKKNKPLTPLGELMYGFSLYSTEDEYFAKEASALSYLYGIDTTIPFMEINNDINSILKENSFYKRALKFYFNANQKDLLDPDSRTQTFEGYKKKYNSGRVLFSNYSDLVEKFNIKEKEVGFTGNSYVPVIAEDMKIYIKEDNPVGNGWYYGITTNSQNPDYAAKLLNWLYSKENISLLYNGPEDVTWTMTDTGPKVIDTAWTIIRNKNENLMNGYPFNNLDYFGTLGLTPATKMENGYSLSYKYWPSTLHLEKLIFFENKNSFNTIKGNTALNFMKEPPKRIQEVNKSLGAVIKENSWDMIYAKDEAEFEKIWKQMLRICNDLGMKQVELTYKNLWYKALEKEKEYEK